MSVAALTNTTSYLANSLNFIQNATSKSEACILSFILQREKELHVALAGVANERQRIQLSHGWRRSTQS